MFGRLKGVAVGCAALVIASTALYAAGNWSTLPIVGYSSYCASTVTGTGGLGGITGQGQGSLGSICAQTVPAGPASLTGNEVVPADLYNPSTISQTNGGVSPATGLLSLASLNAMPLTVTSVISATTTQLTPTSVSGGFVLHSTGAITGIQVWMPAAPIDGQQFALTADNNITTLTINVQGAVQTISNKPTALTTSTTGSYGYRYMYNAAATNWYRLQ